MKKQKLQARSFPAITVRDRSSKDRRAVHEIDLDDTVEDQLEDAFGERAIKSLLLVVTDAEGFDKGAIKEMSSGGGVSAEELVILGEMVDEHDAEMAAAAIIAANGDMKHAEQYAENLAWVGSPRDDESDYAHHVVEEGLMGDNLDQYFDYKSFGRDLVMDADYYIEMGHQLVVFNS